MADQKTRVVIEIAGQNTSGPAFKAFDKSMKQSQVAMGSMNRSARQWRGMMGQMGHQAQDVAVQLQMGTNAMIVLGQQGGQIAAVFGPYGAIAGAIISVGAALGMAAGVMGQTKSAADQLTSAQDKLNSVLDKGKGSVFGYSEELKELARVSKGLAELKIATAVVETQNALNASFEEMGGMLGESTSQWLDFSDDVAGAVDFLALKGLSLQEVLDLRKTGDLGAAQFLRLKNAQTELAEEFGISSSEAETLLNRFASLDASKPTESINNLSAALAGIDAEGEGAAAFAAFRVQVADIAGSALDASLKLKALMKVVEEGSPEEFALGTVDLGDPHDAMLVQYEEYLKDKQTLSDAADKEFQADLKAQKAAEAALTESANEEILAIDHQMAIDANMGFLALQKAHYGIIQSDKEAHDEEMLRLTDLYWRKNAAIAEIAGQGTVVATRQQLGQALTFATGAVDQISSILSEGGEQNKAAFLMQKAFNIASIIANTEMAATAAGAQAAVFAGAPGWFTISNMVRASGYGAAGAVAGQTLASFEGGGITFDGIRAGGIDGKGGKMAIVHPNEKITDLEKDGEGQGVNVNFNIYAWDTETGAEQIQKQRGTIITMLNRAMNNQGQRGQYR